MSTRRYLEDPIDCAAINGAIRRAFDRRCGRATTAAHILVVAEDARTREMIERRLRRAGHEPISVANEHEAIDAIGPAKFDLVLAEITLPKREGLRTIAALRRAHPDVAIVAFASPEGSERYLRVARAFGATATLTGPLDQARLAEATDRTLARRSTG